MVLSFYQYLSKKERAKKLSRVKEMLDIHCHILPGVDDGSKDFETSLKMLELEIENGVKTIIVTPHQFLKKANISSREELYNIYLRFQEETKHLPITILFGAEIYYNKLAKEAIKNHTVITMNNSNTILMEFSLLDEVEIDEIVHDTMIRGYHTIVAHPERYSYMTIQLAKSIKQAGGSIQLNTSSILGNNGRKIKRKAFKLMKEDLVDYIASDAHSINLRKPNLKECYKLVEKKFGNEYAKRIFLENANSLKKSIGIL